MVAPARFAYCTHPLCRLTTTNVDPSSYPLCPLVCGRGFGESPPPPLPPPPPPHSPPPPPCPPPITPLPRLSVTSPTRPTVPHFPVHLEVFVSSPCSRSPPGFSEASAPRLRPGLGAPAPPHPCRRKRPRAPRTAPISPFPSRAARAYSSATASASVRGLWCFCLRTRSRSSLGPHPGSSGLGFTSPLHWELVTGQFGAFTSSWDGTLLTARLWRWSIACPDGERDRGPVSEASCAAYSAGTPVGADCVGCWRPIPSVGLGGPLGHAC